MPKGLGEGRDGAFGTNENRSAGGVGADGVELDAGLLGRADASRVFGRAEIEDELGRGEEEADVGLIHVQGHGG